MKALNKVFTKEQVVEAANRIFKTTIEKVKDELDGSFYQEMDSFLADHYDKAKKTIENELIKEIADTFIANPTEYKYATLRNRMFEENKDKFIPLLTNDAIFKSVEQVIMNYTHSDYLFDWQWKDGIVRIIADNWHLFKDDERVNNGLLRKIDQLNNHIKGLQAKIRDFNNDEL